MVNTLKKGNAWRVKVYELLVAIPQARIFKRGIGEAGDDLIVKLPGLGELSIECKDEVSYDLAGWVTQAEGQARRGQLPIVVAHRRGKREGADGYVIMSGRVFAELLKRAGRA